jgi:hypothetical protein
MDSIGVQGVTINGVPVTLTPDRAFCYRVVFKDGVTTITAIAMSKITVKLSMRF